MDEEERAAIIHKISERVLSKIELLPREQHLAYIERLVGMLDELHLMTLNFAFEMSPESDQLL